jgi:hypothetical protein
MGSPQLLLRDGQKAHFAIVVILRVYPYQIKTIDSKGSLRLRQQAARQRHSGR